MSVFALPRGRRLSSHTHSLLVELTPDATSTHLNCSSRGSDVIDCELAHCLRLPGGQPVHMRAVGNIIISTVNIYIYIYIRKEELAITG